MRVSRLLLAVATPTTLLGFASLAFSASAPLAVFQESTTPPNAAVSELTPEQRALAGWSRAPFERSGHSERWAGFAFGFAAALDWISPDEAPEDCEVAERLQRQIRVDDLPGAEFPVEGVLADGAEIDWASYRGKVVYFVAYNSEFLSNESSSQNTTLSYRTDYYRGKSFAQLRDQYADAGFAILLYDLASKPPKPGTAPNSFGVEPSGVLSRALTRGAEKNYADLSELYLSLQLPGTGIIVDVDGKVLDAKASPFDFQTQRKLETLLQERFPNVDGPRKSKRRRSRKRSARFPENRRNRVATQE